MISYTGTYSNQNLIVFQNQKMTEDSEDVCFPKKGIAILLEISLQIELVVTIILRVEHWYFFFLRIMAWIRHSHY